MISSSVGPVSLLTNLVPSTSATSNAAGTGTNFADFLNQALDQANNLSSNADALSASYAAGGPVSLDQVMLAEQQASLALDLVVQVRDRVVNAYQTVMNMQV